MNAETSLYNKVDLAWLVFLTATGSILSVFLSEGFFDLSIFLSGILCVGLIAIGRREGYLIGLYNSLSYAILAYGNDLYGEVYLNLFFFIPTGILGYVMWRYHMTSGKPLSCASFLALAGMHSSALFPPHRRTWSCIRAEPTSEHPLYRCDHQRPFRRGHPADDVAIQGAVVLIHPAQHHHDHHVDPPHQGRG